MPPRVAANGLAVLVLAVVCVLTASTAPLHALQAQSGRESAAAVWNDPRTISLVDRAIARRSAQLADSGLADYRAVAHGYLTFLAQLGEGYPDPPQVVRADELAVEVYWRAPNQSKQRVVGRRDTLMLPTDINYHRDHLAIVQNNFPAIIRLGDGDEVRDVPHPLSGRGRDAYEFAITDSLSIRVGARSWDVMQVDVRPRDDRQPRAVGALYLDRESAAVVRMSISFTRAALIDPALDDVSVVLDNGLIEGRFWLPRRQVIEIRRSGTWLEFPARGIIRGEWDLCCMEPNRGVPAELFAGPEITFAPPPALKAYAFPGQLSDSIAVRVQLAMADGGTQQLQEQAARIVREAALAKAAGATLAVRRVSDFVRVNRVEGLALGAGTSLRLGGPWSVRLSGRYGLDDHRIKHELGVHWQSLSGLKLGVATFDDLRPAGEVDESSLIGNSIASQELGVDLTDLFRAEGISLVVQGGNRLRWRLSAERVRESPVGVHGKPWSGNYRLGFVSDVASVDQLQWELSGSRLAGPVESVWSGSGTLALVSSNAPLQGRRVTNARAQINVTGEHELGPGLLTLRTVAASVFGARVPVQQQVMFGGPETAPGYATHTLRGGAGVTSRLEWRARVGSFPVSLARFGTTRVPVILAPFVQGAWVSSATGPSSTVGPQRSAGFGLISLHDLLRLDVARGLDRGGKWSLRLDFGHAFWPIL